jgi:hypothetical protein
MVYIAFKLVFGTIAEHAFAIKAMNKMCMIRTQDENMLATVVLEPPAEDDEGAKALKYNKITV